eukprot:Rmarinus@m.25108
MIFSLPRVTRITSDLREPESPQHCTCLLVLFTATWRSRTSFSILCRRTWRENLLMRRAAQSVLCLTWLLKYIFNLHPIYPESTFGIFLVLCSTFEDISEEEKKLLKRRTYFFKKK